ncbi:MAG TPA: hypothetical protein PLE54_01865 [Burkholderiaceae bacterium]|nr:hypothetical protein [Burkholderiaceae bacterium]
MMRLALLACAALTSFAAEAATYRVEEAGTFPQESTAPMRWRQIAPSRGGDNTVEGTTTVNVRLNLAPWQNRVGRLFMVLPEQPLTPVRVSWSTQGRLLSGQLVSGHRALVYAGPITMPLLEETLVLKFEADGTRLNSAQRLQFHFEIDID